ncbi:MAG TPA: hypothetical protein VLH38_03330 [Patescibacteria group bacterium]|nr:hypothetical protein [Patescibacteria group bacterium]
MKHVIEISSVTNKRVRTKKVEATPEDGLALVVVQHGIKLERVYVDVRVKFDDSGRLVVIQLEESKWL